MLEGLTCLAGRYPDSSLTILKPCPLDSLINLDMTISSLLHERLILQYYNVSLLFQHIRKHKSVINYASMKYYLTLLIIHEIVLVILYFSECFTNREKKDNLS